MKSKIFILPFLCLLANDSCKKLACAGAEGSKEEVVKKVDPFTAIELNGKVDLVLTQDTVCRVKVTAGSAVIPSVQTAVQDGKLIITNNSECAWLQNPTQKVTVYASIKQLKNLRYNGSGTINCTNTLLCDTLRFYSNIGAGIVNLNVAADQLYAEIEFESTTLNIKGTANYSYCYGNARADMNLENFLVKHLKIGWVGARDVRVHATDRLEAVIYHTGNVYYKGSPAQINTIYYASGRLYPLP